MGLDSGPLADGTTSGIAGERLLFVWLSPSFPVGAFAYSQGLEMAVERGLVTSRATLQDWMSALIAHGALRNDLIFLAAAYQAVTTRNNTSLVSINALACALQPSAERYLEATQQGGSFLTAIAGAWSNDAFTNASAQLDGTVAYPIAVGVASAAHGISLTSALEAFAFAWAGTLTSAAIRLSAIGQTEAQSVIAALANDLSSAARHAHTQALDQIGGAAFSADLASLEHETQYSRLFRS
jgi:urease accessory protein